MNKIVVIESPFAGDVGRNLAYLRRAVLHSIGLGETPFASHGFYPLFLDDEKPEERALGISLGYNFYSCCRLVAFYIDYDWSPGMLQARVKLASDFPSRKITMRRIGTNEEPK